MKLGSQSAAHAEKLQDMKDSSPAGCNSEIYRADINNDEPLETTDLGALLKLITAAAGNY